MTWNEQGAARRFGLSECQYERLSGKAGQRIIHL